MLAILAVLVLSDDTPAYLDPSQPIQARVEDLLSRMTIEEKLGQMHQASSARAVPLSMTPNFPGSALSALGMEARGVLMRANRTRLRIPVLIGIDAIHGHSFYPGATIFPIQLGIACSWDEALIEMQGNVTAYEMRYTGPHWAFSPVLCIARDLRWGRVGETFGEDPLLIGRFGAALIRGLQGPDGITPDPDKVMACAKHYAGYSETEGGRDASEADLTQRKLRSWFLPPFQKAVQTKVGSFMSAYQAIQGVPATAHAWLLRDVLKNEWGFDGMVLTDWNNVGYMVGTQQIASSFEEAALLTVSSGNDMVMSTPQFYTGSLSALESKQLDMKDVDDAVRRVLEAKFKLGLFEDPRWPDIERASERIGQPFSRAQALLAAEESLVLLKNNGILPLNESQLQSIAIVGPNADHALQMSGDWSLGSGQWNNEEKHPRNCTVTVLDGFRERFPGEIRYEPGAFIEPQEPEVSHNAAIDEVSNSNVSIVVVGDRPSLYGERKSTATLELRGTQKKFLKAVASTNRPFILVVISSKPLVIDAAIRDKAAAIIWQFCPGMLGGRATARAVFGDYSPSGRLPITIPKHVGQLPVFYQQVRGQHGWTYADLTQAPAYAFGFGLTYTTIEYISAATDKWVYKMDEDIIVTVKLLNSGTWSAVEVVQVYVSDVVTSATWVDQELKGFKRVLIEAGDTIDVDIVVKVEDLSIVNADNERVVEPGEFQFRVGKAANDIKHYLHVQVIE